MGITGTGTFVYTGNSNTGADPGIFLNGGGGGDGIGWVTESDIPVRPNICQKWGGGGPGAPPLKLVKPLFVLNYVCTVQTFWLRLRSLAQLLILI